MYSNSCISEGTGEMHIIVVSKEELRRQIKICKYENLAPIIMGQSGLICLCYPKEGEPNE